MLGRNVVGCVVLAAAAVARGSVALTALGIDLLDCIIVVWQLRAPTPGSGHAQRSQIIATRSPAGDLHRDPTVDRARKHRSPRPLDVKMRRGQDRQTVGPRCYQGGSPWRSC
jgi:hypothetical protein